MCVGGWNLSPPPRGCPCTPPHPTLLRSLAVTPSSSRQGSLWTKASIWYLARMNSDLVGLMAGLGGTAGCGVSGERSARPAQTPPAPPRGVVGGHLLHFVLGVCLPAPALHLGRIQQRVLPDGVGPVARQGVNHLRRRGRARWVPGGGGSLWCTCVSPPPPCPRGVGTHLEQGGGPGAVAQVLDDGDVAAQAAVHAAALVADEHPAVDGGPARVCGVSRGCHRVSPPLRSPPPHPTPLLPGGTHTHCHSNCFPGDGEGLSPSPGETHGFPIATRHQPNWGGGAGFGLPHQEGGRWQGRCQRWQGRCQHRGSTSRARAPRLQHPAEAAHPLSPPAGHFFGAGGGPGQGQRGPQQWAPTVCGVPRTYGGHRLCSLSTPSQASPAGHPSSRSPPLIPP